MDGDTNNEILIPIGLAAGQKCVIKCVSAWQHQLFALFDIELWLLSRVKGKTEIKNYMYFDRKLLPPSRTLYVICFVIDPLASFLVVKTRYAQCHCECSCQSLAWST